MDIRSLKIDSYHHQGKDGYLKEARQFISKIDRFLQWYENNSHILFSVSVEETSPSDATAKTKDGLTHTKRILKNYIDSIKPVSSSTFDHKSSNRESFKNIRKKK